MKMKYDFDKIIDRSGEYAVKYEERLKKFGTDDVIPMWIADMDFQTAKPIRDAIEQRAAKGIFGYVSKPDSYLEAAASWVKRRHQWDIDPKMVSRCVGIVPALSELVREFTGFGESVLIQPPVYPEFFEVIEAWEGRHVLENRLLEKDGYYTLDLADFEEKLKLGPKLFILCNPHNPVGRVWSVQELRAMMELCIKYKVPVASDEIHGDLELFENKYTPTGKLSSAVAANTISCFSATKTFNLAGLQSCCIVFPNQQWKDRFDKFWEGFDIHRNNCFSLVAMQAGWLEGDEWLDQLRSYIEGNMIMAYDFFQKECPKIKFWMPEATYMIWLDCRALGMKDAELFRFMIEKAKVGMNNGQAFCPDLDGFMRMNLAMPRATVLKALMQIKEAVSRL